MVPMADIQMATSAAIKWIQNRLREKCIGFVWIIQWNYTHTHTKRTKSVLVHSEIKSFSYPTLFLLYEVFFDFLFLFPNTFRIVGTWDERAQFSLGCVFFSPQFHSHLCFVFAICLSIAFTNVCHVSWAHNVANYTLPHWFFSVKCYGILPLTINAMKFTSWGWFYSHSLGMAVVVATATTAAAAVAVAVFPYQPFCYSYEGASAHWLFNSQTNILNNMKCARWLFACGLCSIQFQC